MRLLYIQPLLPNYRHAVLKSFQREFDLVVASDRPSAASGFGELYFNGVFIECFTRSFFKKKIFYQSGAAWSFIKYKPDVVFACANVRDLAYWLVLFLAFFYRVPVFSHGQGLYAKSEIGFFSYIAYRIIGWLSFRYVSYSTISHESLMRIGFPSEKLLIAENSIDVFFNAGDFPKTGDEPGIMFIGRLRAETGIDVLINAVENLRLVFPDVVLHIVGGGEFEDVCRKKYNFDWVRFYGAVYDDNKILEISRLCRVGCYPGNAGLSVVHFFSLRLPPIVHDRMCSHMGPEPSYVEDGVNGFLFRHDGFSGELEKALRRVWNMPANEFLDISENSYREYLRLNSPGLGQRLVQLISCALNK